MKGKACVGRGATGKGNLTVRHQTIDVALVRGHLGADGEILKVNEGASGDRSFDCAAHQANGLQADDAVRTCAAQ